MNPLLAIDEDDGLIYETYKRQHELLTMDIKPLFPSQFHPIMISTLCRPTNIFKRMLQSPTLFTSCVEDPPLKKPKVDQKPRRQYEYIPRPDKVFHYCLLDRIELSVHYWCRWGVHMHIQVFNASRRRGKHNLGLFFIVHHVQYIDYSLIKYVHVDTLNQCFSRLGRIPGHLLTATRLPNVFKVDPAV